MEITRSEWSRGTIGSELTKESIKNQHLTVSLSSQSLEETGLLELFARAAIANMRGKPSMKLRRQGQLCIVEITYDGNTVIRVFRVLDSVKVAAKVLKEFNDKFRKYLP